MAETKTRRTAAVARLDAPTGMAQRVMAALMVVCVLGLLLIVRPQPDGHVDFVQPAYTLLDFREGAPQSATSERIGQITERAGPADVLQVLGATPIEAAAAVDALRETGLINVKRMRVGTAVAAYFDEGGGDGAGRLLAVAVKPDARNTLMATRLADDGFLASVLSARVETAHKRLAGTIETTLVDAVVKAGGNPEHVRQFAALFPEDPGLAKGGQRGERFDLIFEIAVDERGTTLETGDVIFAAFNGYRVAGSWYRHSPSDTSGIARDRFLTRFPIGRRTVNSGFGQRNHPVTGLLHLHSGVDFKAALGTPVYAAGDGIIRTMANHQGYGQMVVIRHLRDFETVYAHLSKFSETVKPGTRVKHGDLIGYVGETGTATGPHLHYEIRQKGRLLNPMTISLPSGRDLTAQPELYAEFTARRDEINGLRGEVLRIGTPAVAAAARTAATVAP
jgi:murein DD-endopeptidase MepM/ murein hydrolase activator NlpD